MKGIYKGMILASTAASLILSATVAFGADQSKKTAVKCHGINSCRGKGQCGEKGKNACQGQNTCKGKGYLYVEGKKECQARGGEVLK